MHSLQYWQSCLTFTAEQCCCYGVAKDYIIVEMVDTRWYPILNTSTLPSLNYFYAIRMKLPQNILFPLPLSKLIRLISMQIFDEMQDAQRRHVLHNPWKSHSFLPSGKREVIRKWNTLLTFPQFVHEPKGFMQMRVIVSEWNYASSAKHSYLFMLTKNQPKYALCLGVIGQYVKKCQIWPH